MTPVLLLVVILTVAALASLLIYNKLVGLRVLSENAWSDIDVQLKRRHDLIPNVVEAVKGYAAHERQTLNAVVTARSRAMSAEGPTARGEAEAGLTLALRNLFALVEAYPQLRAVESFAQLQSTLSQVEDAIQNARRYYNAVVRDLNTTIQRFPSNLVAGLFGFTAREFFQLSQAAEADVPTIDFSGQTKT